MTPTAAVVFPPSGWATTPRIERRRGGRNFLGHRPQKWLERRSQHAVQQPALRRLPRPHVRRVLVAAEAAAGSPAVPLRRELRVLLRRDVRRRDGAGGA